MKSKAIGKWHFTVVYYGGLALCCYFTYLHMIGLRTGNGSLILNAAPNFLAVPITCSFAFAVTNGNKKLTALFCALGVIGYELMQLGMEERTFDSFDVLFSVFGYQFMLLAITVERKITSRA
ncbi:hypothetical protein KUL49_08110 [Alteromonas sp. KUL17]|uniref:hypothetical protein n=1 Tax=Alteromonas sp. KUL17 TaxID=2480796 RepID=UPI001037964D|nr:hypothetical protein [Alteromonas sp. KUL17]TAP29006.1 hypothetical protein KUL49_08110 [Alteromonas sp. KUL17]